MTYDCTIVLHRGKVFKYTRVLRYNKDALPSTIEGFLHMRDILLDHSSLY